jgi:hypothetical protein
MLFAQFKGGGLSDKKRLYQNLLLLARYFSSSGADQKEMACERN